MEYYTAKVTEISKNLIDKERVHLANLLLKGVTCDQCDQCGDLANYYRSECDAYKHYTETLCDSCAEYCESCDQYYGESGSYKHKHIDCIKYLIE